VDVCENYWDACISDNPLAKYDDGIEYGREECRKVTDRACGSYKGDDFSGSEPEDSTAGAFDLGPYSTVSQVTVPRISLGSATTSAVSGISGSTRVVAGSATATRQSSTSTAVSSGTVTASRISASPVTQTPSSTAIAQVTEVSKAGRMMNGVPGRMATSVAGALLVSVLMI